VLGRALVPGPLVWGCLAAALGVAGEGVGGGSVVGGIEPRAVAGLAPLLVEHLDSLDALLVLDDGGITRVEPAALGGERLDWPLDPLTPLYLVATLPPGEPVGDAVAAHAARRTGAVLTAAYLVGMAAAATELSVEYARERRQFDRPIGSFQAVKHLLADSVARLEVARAGVYAAAAALDDPEAPEAGDAGRAAASAKVVAGETALRCCRTAVQVHGGMGFTWEVDAHLYLKRAWVLDTVFGSTAEHAHAVAATLVR
jgi:Acyl-CoA dehydrogenase, C-terminal domain